MTSEAAPEDVSDNEEETEADNSITPHEHAVA